MKSIFDSIANNPRTTVFGCLAAGLTLALLLKIIAIQDYSVALGAVAALLGLTAKDGEK